MLETIVELADVTYKFEIEQMFYEGDEVTFTVYVKQGDDWLPVKTITRKARYNRDYGVYFLYKGYAISNYEFE